MNTVPERHLTGELWQLAVTELHRPLQERREKRVPSKASGTKANLAYEATVVESNKLQRSKVWVIVQADLDYV
jgi:hypothetical protein